MPKADAPVIPAGAPAQLERIISGPLLLARDTERAISQENVEAIKRSGEGCR